MTETDVLLYLYHCLWYTSIAVISTEFQLEAEEFYDQVCVFLFLNGFLEPEPIGL